MVDEKEAPPDDQKQEPEEVEEEITEPHSKYERIMMAAAEASRLNEEIRRKGTKLDQKVTLEALERVREGKVKAVLAGKTGAPPPRPEMPAAEVPEGLFGNPPLVPTEKPDEPAEESENGDGDESKSES